VEYTIRVENNSNTTRDYRVEDTISGSGYITGSNGGRLEYVNNSQDVDFSSGAGGAVFDGEIDQSGGVEIEDLPAGESATITYEMEVDSNEDSEFDNVVELFYNNTLVDSDDERVTTEEDIDDTITKVATDRTIEDGERVEYIIRVQNNSNSTRDYRVEDTISGRGYITGSNGGRLEYVNNSQDVDFSSGAGGADYRGEIDESGGIEIEDLPAGEYAEITYELEADSDQSSEFDNVVELFYNNTLVDSDDETVETEADNDDTITKEADDRVIEDGESVEYTIVVRNNSSQTRDYRVEDTISGRGYITGSNGGRLEYVNGSTDVDFSSGADDADWRGDMDDSDGIEIEDLPAGEYAEITYRLRADSNRDSTFENEADLYYNNVVVDTAYEEVEVEEDEDDDVIEKEAEDTRIIDGEIVEYSIRVENNSNQTRDYRIEDTISGSGLIIGSNGGRLEYIENSMRVRFSSGADDADYRGEIDEEDGIEIEDLPAGEYVEITYEMEAEAGSSDSDLDNRADLYYRGDIIDWSTERVEIEEDDVIEGDIDLSIRKQIRDDNGNYIDADFLSTALVLDENRTTTVRYRVIVNNDGSFSAEDVEIRDLFSGDFDQESIRNVSGADWDETDRIFTIDRVRAEDAEIFTFDANITTGSSGYGRNRVEIIDFEFDRSGDADYILTDSEGIGRSDDAFTSVQAIPLPDPESDFSKIASVSQARRGEEIDYTIRVRNSGNSDLTDLRIVDIFPSEFLEITKAPQGVVEGNTIAFRRNILGPGHIWDVQYTARVKESTPIGQVIHNFVTLETKEMPDKTTEEDVLVVQTEVNQGPPGGPAGTITMMILTALALAAFPYRKQILNYLQEKYAALKK
jgi:uncharacterized repeat protein (TIGR01451 family)